VTTLIAEGCPKPALAPAARTQTAAYAVTNWDTLAAVPVGARAREIDRASAAEWRTGSTRGTRVHGYAAQLIAGEQVDVPDEYVDVVDRCLDFLTDWDVQELFVEVAVINREWRYMGTVDLIGQAGGEVWLFDWKTGRSGIYPEVALQLAAYAHSETILRDDGLEVPLPQIARAAAVWLRADGYDVHEVDISGRTFEAFLYVREVANWRQLPREDTVGPALPPPAISVP
jgi:hypothetical protein